MLRKCFVSSTAALMAAMLLLSACGQAAVPAATPEVSAEPADTAAQAAPAPVQDAPAVVVVGDVAGAGVPAIALPEGITFSESPWFEGRGFPPVEERLPASPRVWQNDVLPEVMEFQLGRYNRGPLRTIRMHPVQDWNNITASSMSPVNSPGRLGQSVQPNLLYSLYVSEDLSTFTFNLRPGTRWSDGHPVTSQDGYFAFNYFHLDERLFPSTVAWWRAGGTPHGEPARLEIIDRYSWRIIFDEPTGGKVLRLAFVPASEILQPYHHLRYFHIDIADEDELRAKVEDHGFLFPGEWPTFFQYHRLDNNNLGRTAFLPGGTPVLSPWVHYQDGDVRVFQRNPFFWQIDHAGQQLPYIDYHHSYFVVDAAAGAIRLLAGDVDHGYEWIPLAQLPLFAEHAETGNYRITLENLFHRSYGDIHINQTYDCPVWRSVAQDVRFRQALAMSINRDHIMEAVYIGFAARPAHSIQDQTYDPERANALLDEMGMIRGADGMRLAPCGSTFIMDVANSGFHPGWTPKMQIASESWRDLGININLRMHDQPLIAQMALANELQISIGHQHGNVQPMFDMWSHNNTGRAWHQYWETAGAAGEAPPPAVLEWYQEIAALRTASFDEIPAIRQRMFDIQREQIFSIILAEDVVLPTLVNNDLRNVPDAGMMTAGLHSTSIWWFDR